MTEQEQRAAAACEARLWLRPSPTPYLDNARIRGVGADCETFICEVFNAIGLFTAQNIPFVPSQWYLNTKEELYLKYLSRYAAEYEFTPGRSSHPPQTGDIICVKHRWVYAHGAIVLDWPNVIHCFPPCVQISNVLFNPVFASGQIKFFNPWGVRP